MGPRGATASPAYGRRTRGQTCANSPLHWPFGQLLPILKTSSGIAETDPRDLTRCHVRLYDRFGRTLAYLDKADGWDYSVEAARAGAAHSYVYHGHPSARADEIAAAEQAAKAVGRGCGGRRASVKRRQSQSDSPRCLRPTVRPRGRAPQWARSTSRTGRAGVHRVAGGGAV